MRSTKFSWSLIVVFTFMVNGYAQSFSGVIVDDQNRELANVQIRDTVNNFYLLHSYKGVYSVGQINLTNGKLEDSIQLNDIPFAENIQIFNGWVYYLKSNNGFHKLYKKKI